MSQPNNITSGPSTQLKSGTAAEWSQINPVLDDGEPGYERDTKTFKIGDGTSSWSALNPVGGSGISLSRPASADVQAAAGVYKDGFTVTSGLTTSTPIYCPVFDPTFMEEDIWTTDGEIAVVDGRIVIAKAGIYRLSPWFVVSPVAASGDIPQNTAVSFGVIFVESGGTVPTDNLRNEESVGCGIVFTPDYDGSTPLEYPRQFKDALMSALGPVLAQGSGSPNRRWFDQLVGYGVDMYFLPAGTAVIPYISYPVSETVADLTAAFEIDFMPVCYTE